MIDKTKNGSVKSEKNALKRVGKSARKESAKQVTLQSTRYKEKSAY